MVYGVIFGYNQYSFYECTYPIKTLKEFGYVLLEDIRDIKTPKVVFDYFNFPTGVRSYISVWLWMIYQCYNTQCLSLTMTNSLLLLY